MSNTTDTIDKAPDSLNTSTPTPTSTAGTTRSLAGFPTSRGQIPTPTETPAPTAQGSTIKYSEDIVLYDKEYQREVSGINWGVIRKGAINFYEITVKNTGEEAITLHLSSANWTPGISHILMWDYDGKSINTNSTVSITLSLIIVSANVNSFTNDIIISSANSN